MISFPMENQDRVTQNPSDFSIDHILNRAGNGGCSRSASGSGNRCDYPETEVAPVDTFSWLQCTRYCPPKVPRVQRREGPQKRQLGRHPRIPFTSHQLSLLEEKFQQTPYLSSEEVIVLSRRLQLADIRVKIWFQNRRARERREKSSQKSEKSVSETVTAQPLVKQEPVTVIPANFWTSGQVFHNIWGHLPFTSNPTTSSSAENS